MVSKHRDRPYQGGRSKHWVKVKNRKSNACKTPSAAPLQLADGRAEAVELRRQVEQGAAHRRGHDGDRRAD